jgi:hypothetical protein
VHERALACAPVCHLGTCAMLVHPKWYMHAHVLDRALIAGLTDHFVPIWHACLGMVSESGTERRRLELTHRPTGRKSPSQGGAALTKLA